jgi:hypothetical protein
MPNWVWNRVTVYGEPEQLEAFRKQAGAPTPLDEEPIFSFWNFIKPSDDILGEYRPDKALPGGDNSPNNWYNWNNREWGTKWDACSPGFTDSDTGKSIEYRFDTAWGHPEPVFYAMIQQFPELYFSIYYREEQGWGGQIDGSGGVFWIVDEWDIPNSHEEYMERDGHCYCFDDEPIYDDCPKREEEAHSDLSTVS